MNRVYKRGYSFFVRIGSNKWEIVNGYKDVLETQLSKIGIKSKESKK